MMNRSFLFLAVCLSMAASASCFLSPSFHRPKSSLAMVMDQAPPAIITESIVFNPHRSNSYSSASSSINDGINRFITGDESSTSAIMTSTNVLSLKERPPPPTPEEIAAKKRTFNLWFWGGGFVAPFLATFYYFGFKFWER